MKQHHYASRDIEDQIKHLELTWSSLLAASEEKKERLQQAYQVSRKSIHCSHFWLCSHLVVQMEQLVDCACVSVSLCIWAITFEIDVWQVDWLYQNLNFLHLTWSQCLLLYLIDWKHTHPFNGPFSGTTQVGRYQNRVNQSGFYWSTRQWMAVTSAGPYASLHLAPDR